MKLRAPECTLVVCVLTLILVCVLLFRETREGFEPVLVNNPNTVDPAIVNLSNSAVKDWEFSLNHYAPAELAKKTGISAMEAESLLTEDPVVNYVKTKGPNYKQAMKNKRDPSTASLLLNYGKGIPSKDELDALESVKKVKVNGNFNTNPNVNLNKKTNVKSKGFFSSFGLGGI